MYKVNNLKKLSTVFQEPRVDGQSTVQDPKTSQTGINPETKEAGNRKYLKLLLDK